MRLAPFLLAVPLLTSTLDDYFSRASAHGFSGSVIVTRGDEVLLRKAYGLADRRAKVPATPQTAYSIASLDKQFIAAAILRLEELGKLKTSDPVRRFIPGAPAAITLHQLLSHTSGLRNEYWDEHPQMSREAFVRFVLTEQPLESPPGTKWDYSNSAFIVLERVIELASGKEYEAFLREALFEPAGMRHTGFALPAWKPGQVAHYDLWTVDASTLPGDAHYNDPLKRPAPFRMLLSTADDLLLWHRALRDGKVLSGDSRRRLVTPVMEDYAYGWNVVKTARGTRLVHHGGSDSNTGMLATYRDFTDEGVFFTILTNSLQVSLATDYVAADVEAILFGGSVTMPPPTESNHDTLSGHFGPWNVVAVDGGPIVMATTDRAAMLALSFPAGHAEQDETANEVLRAAFAGDLAPLRAASHASEAYLKQVEEEVAALTKRYGAVTSVKTVAQRTFVFDGSAEVHSYERVDFEHGTEVLRAIRLGSGRLRFSRFNLPPGIEAVLAPAGPGRWTTWNWKLGSGAVVRRSGQAFVIQGE